MDNNTSWQDFCLLYYDQAMSSAKYHIWKFKSTSYHWDSRIDEDVICVDAVMEALQKAYSKYDPTRGASLSTYLSRLVHNELINELERESKALSAKNDLSSSQEADYTFRSMVSHIPEKAMEELKEKLRSAILKLSPIDQSILGFFLEDPSTFVEQSVASLGVTPGYVSVHKNRAIAKLPALMNMSSGDYFDLYEDHTFAGLKAKHKSIRNIIPHVNPICLQFDLECTVSRLYEAICLARQENV